MENAIRIEIGNGNKLVVMQNPDPDFSKEVFAMIEDKDGRWIQDLAIIRPSYHYADNEKGEPVPKFSKNTFDIIVYADCGNDDYTNKFEVRLYEH